MVYVVDPDKTDRQDDAKILKYRDPCGSNKNQEGFGLGLNPLPPFGKGT